MVHNLKARRILVVAGAIMVGAIALYLLATNARGPAAYGDVVIVRMEGEHQGSADLSAVGYFDGDQQPDEAFFRERQSGNYELVVSLSSVRQAVALAELDSVNNMGVKTLGPGTYTTVCGKGYGGIDCDGSDEVIDLTRDAVLLFQYEGSSSVFFWKAGAFATAYLSD